MMEAVIKQKVDQIAECVFDKVQKSEESFFGLYSGEFGQLLFLLYYSRFSQSEKHVLLTVFIFVLLSIQYIQWPQSDNNPRSLSSWGFSP